MFVPFRKIRRKQYQSGKGLGAPAANLLPLALQLLKS